MPIYEGEFLFQDGFTPLNYGRVTGTLCLSLYEVSIQYALGYLNAVSVYVYRYTVRIYILISHRY